MKSKTAIIRTLKEIGITQKTITREIPVRYNCYGNRGKSYRKSTALVPWVNSYGHINFSHEGIQGLIIIGGTSQVWGGGNSTAKKSLAFAKMLARKLGTELLWSQAKTSLSAVISPEGEIRRPNESAKAA